MHHKKIVVTSPRASDPAIRKLDAKEFFAATLYDLSVPLAFVSVYLSMATFVLIPALFFVPDILPAAASRGGQST